MAKTELGEETKMQIAMAAERVDQNVGIDIASIIAIFTSVLPSILKCFQTSEGAQMATLKQDIAKANERRPRVLRRQLARRIQSQHRDRKLTDDQAHQLAEGLIEQALDESTVQSDLQSVFVDCGCESFA